LHVVWHTRKGVANLRGRSVFHEIRQSLRRCHEKEGFRLTDFSVQGNHVHFLAEADSAEALSRGMQGLGVSIAKRINRCARRRGPVFEERYFVRQLRTPREVANALDYILHNEERHLERQGLQAPGRPDPCSSAASANHGLVAEPKTWLLRRARTDVTSPGCERSPSPGKTLARVSSVARR
jgi:REP element-mobilizing transposase RayT